jgi:hypothetical protein
LSGHFSDPRLRGKPATVGVQEGADRQDDMRFGVVEPRLELEEVWRNLRNAKGGV